jgi:iron-sulfur cluster assembly accessory protein
MPSPGAAEAASCARRHLAGSHDGDDRHDHLTPWPESAQVRILRVDLRRSRSYARAMDGAGVAETVTLTPYAVEMVKKVRARDGLSEHHALRVGVVGGGCSGFSYQLDFDDQVQEGDQVIEYDGVQVRVDPTSAPYLKGLQIDYVSSLHGGGFKFLNPNASQTCGCGSSFSA